LCPDVLIDATRGSRKSHARSGSRNGEIMAPDAPSTWMAMSRPVLASRSSSAAAISSTGSKLPSNVDPKMATTPIVSSSQSGRASGAVRWNRSPSIGTTRASTSQ